jgi:predicted AlkP superfamily phosphohydrolase/phosphomutase
VNLNTWHVQEGFMAIQGQAPGEKTLQDLFGGGTFWENVDWSRTRAYAMGLGQIYLNLKGREGHGIVDQAQSQSVQDDLASRLLTMTDPKTGARMVDAVYKRDEIYSGAFVGNASELQVGLAEGYRVSWQSTLGGSPPGLVYPNMKKWSGDHGSYDYKTTPGTLISSRPISAGAVTQIIDIAPTVLKYFGVPVPGDIDGKPIF